LVGAGEYNRGDRRKGWQRENAATAARKEGNRCKGGKSAEQVDYPDSWTWAEKGCPGQANTNWDVAMKIGKEKPAVKEKHRGGVP